MAVAVLPLLSAAEPPATGTDPVPAGFFAFVRFMRLAPAALAAALLLGRLRHGCLLAALWSAAGGRPGAVDGPARRIYGRAHSLRMAG